MKKKRVFFMICISLLFFPVYFFSCAAKEPATRKAVLVYSNEGADTESVILENEFLELRFFPATTEIILTEKATGNTWRSNPIDAVSDDGADAVTKQLLQSQFSLLYSDDAGVGMTLSSFSYSVENGMYQYHKIDDALEVDYTVGTIARNYVFPPAVSEERMEEFWAKMPDSDKRKVEASFRLYDIHNLRTNDDRAALLRSYPELADQKLYILRDNTQDYMKLQIEAFFEAAGYTQEDYEADVAKYSPSSVDNKPAFNVTIRYELDGNSLLVTVPFDKIAYRSTYPITQLNLLPFFGAGGTTDEGYLFVPDGSGALINFNNGRQNQIAYNNAVYGWDEAVARDAVVNDSKASYPVFGIHKNGASLLCVIEEGASYASVRADVSGRNCSFNSVSAQFELIHGAEMDISGKSDKSVYLYESRLPEGESLTERFIPCTEGGYVGMAKEYRAYLLKIYPELAQKQTAALTDEVPVAVEILSAVNKIQHPIGIPMDLPLKLTSYNEATAMLEDFASFGWKNTIIKLSGWFNGSVEHSVPSKVKLIRDLGNKKDFSNLVSVSNYNGYPLYTEGDFIFIHGNNLIDSYNSFSDGARYVSRERVSTHPYSFVWFGERDNWGKLTELARPAYTQKLVNGFVSKTAKLGVTHTAFKSIGSHLGADYNEKRRVSREKSLLMQQELLAKLKADNSSGILVKSGFAYVLPYADFITDAALTDQAFGITDASVPFYQIALHSLVPYTGKAINLAEDYTQNLLRTVETGAGLYFSFTAEPTSVLQETKFRQFYANEYSKWKNDADSLYKKFTRDFHGLSNKTIEDHQILSKNVTVTVYSDGTRVIVNASDENFTDGTVAVPRMNYKVIRGDK